MFNFYYDEAHFQQEILIRIMQNKLYEFMTLTLS